MPFFEIILQTFSNDSNFLVTHMMHTINSINLPSHYSADSLVETDGGLFIGSSITLGELARHTGILNFPAIYMALRNTSSPYSRRQKNVGRVLHGDVETQGLAAALLALDADLILISRQRERKLKMAYYFSQENPLSAGEIVKGFVLDHEARHNSVYQSIDYLRSGQAVCGVAVWAQRSQYTLEKVRIVLSGCTPYPVILHRVNAYLQDNECTPDRIEAASRHLGEERLFIYNPLLTIGSHLFNLTSTLIRRALLTL